MSAEGLVPGMDQPTQPTVKRQVRRGIRLHISPRAAMANGHMERYSKSTALRETQGLDTEDQTLDDSCTWGVCNRQSRGDGNSTVAAWGQGGCRSCTGFIPGNDDVLILDHGGAP